MNTHNQTVKWIGTLNPATWAGQRGICCSRSMPASTPGFKTAGSTVTAKSASLFGRGSEAGLLSRARKQAPKNQAVTAVLRSDLTIPDNATSELTITSPAVPLNRAAFPVRSLRLRGEENACTHA
jgi:hypothetical protein